MCIYLYMYVGEYRSSYAIFRTFKCSHLAHALLPIVGDASLDLQRDRQTDGRRLQDLLCELQVYLHTRDK